MTSDIPIFTGDVKDAKKFKKRFAVAMLDRDKTEDATVTKYFESAMDDDTIAGMWFDRLPEDTKASYAKILVEFDNRFCPANLSEEGQRAALTRLMSVGLLDTDVGVMSGGEYRHVKFCDEVMTLAGRCAADTSDAVKFTSVMANIGDNLGQMV